MLAHYMWTVYRTRQYLSSGGYYQNEGYPKLYAESYSLRAIIKNEDYVQDEAMCNPPISSIHRKTLHFKRLSSTSISSIDEILQNLVILHLDRHRRWSQTFFAKRFLWLKFGPVFHYAERVASLLAGHFRKANAELCFQYSTDELKLSNTSA